MSKDSRDWVLVIQVGDMDGVLGSWLQTWLSQACQE